MKRLVRYLGTAFGACAVSVMLAQTVYPCPEYCSQKSLEANYGDDWHFYYFMLGCFLLPESCNGSAWAWVPPEAFAYPMARVHAR